MKKEIRVIVSSVEMRGETILLDFTVDDTVTEHIKSILQAHCPVKLPVDLIVKTQITETPEYPEPGRDGWYVCPAMGCESMFYKEGSKWRRSLAGMELRSTTWQHLCETEVDCVSRGLMYVREMIAEIREKEDFHAGDSAQEVKR